MDLSRYSLTFLIESFLICCGVRERMMRVSCKLLDMEIKKERYNPIPQNYRPALARILLRVVLDILYFYASCIAAFTPPIEVPATISIFIFF